MVTAQRQNGDGYETAQFSKDDWDAICHFKNRKGWKVIVEDAGRFKTVPNTVPNTRQNIILTEETDPEVLAAMREFAGAKEETLLEKAVKFVKGK